MEISSYILLDKLNSKIVSHFAKILIMDNKFPLLKFLSTYLSSTAGSNTYEIVFMGFFNYLKKKLTTIKKKKITLSMSPLQLLKNYNIFQVLGI